MNPPFSRRITPRNHKQIPRMACEFAFLRSIFCMRDAATFCAPPDDRPLLAVLGVVTHEQSTYRPVVRASWLHAADEIEDVIVRFAIRGLNASELILREADEFHDVVFLPARAVLAKYEAALTSTLLWLECAVVAWPSAQFIGKNAACGSSS